MKKRMIQMINSHRSINSYLFLFPTKIMKTKILIGMFLTYGLFVLGTQSQAYLFGMKSRDNGIANIQQIEKKYELDLPMVAFIFDPRGEHVERMMNQFNTEL